MSPRGLVSTLLNSLVVVEGIITKCSSVKPKLVKSMQYCPKTDSYIPRDYRDATSLDVGVEMNQGRDRPRLPTSSVIPSEDGNGNPLDLEFGYCMYKDHQSIILQEMTERARVGQLPRSVEVLLEHDLVDKVKPGDRVQCVGVYRALAPISQGANTSGVFRTLMLCNNVSVIGKEVGAVRLTGTDVANIRCVHIFQIIAVSIIDDLV